MRSRRLLFVALLVASGCTGGAVDTNPPRVAGAPPTGTSVAAGEAATTSTAGTSPPTSTTNTLGPTTTSAVTTTTTLFDENSAGERMQRDLAVLVTLGVREAGSPAEAAASDYLEAVLSDLGAVVEVRPVPLPTGEDSENLLVSFGSDGLHILLGAHYDSKPPSPGADDNGSGTVVLLELARGLAVRPPEGLRVTIAFFGAEEFLIGGGGDDHHFGSRLLAAEMQDEGMLPDLMLSADMIGIGDRMLAATYLDSDVSAALLLQEAGSRLGASIDVERRGDISDHEAFARAGVPSVFFWRPDNPDYHLATDTTADTDMLLEDLAILQEFLLVAGTG